MTIKRRRRGPNKPKPPTAPVALADALAKPPEADAEPAPRRRRQKLGAAAMKLSAPARPGFVRRFFNDTGNRLAEAGELGYEFVSETGIKTSGPGSRVSRLAGTQASGEPLQTFLMETPDELYAEGLVEKEGQAAAIDQAIMSGRDSEGQMSQIPQDERYGQVSMKRDG